MPACLAIHGGDAFLTRKTAFRVLARARLTVPGFVPARASANAEADATVPDTSAVAFAKVGVKAGHLCACVAASPEPS